MKYLIFTLTMPHTNSWNGRWSQQDKKHVIAKPVTATAIPTEKLIGEHFYRWADGWAACVDVELVDNAKEKNQRLKGSDGFCGYGWLADSILLFGKIIRRRQQNEKD